MPREPRENRESSLPREMREPREPILPSLPREHSLPSLPREPRKPSLPREPREPSLPREPRESREPSLHDLHSFQDLDSSCPIHGRSIAATLITRVKHDPLDERDEVRHYSRSFAVDRDVEAIVEACG